MSGALVIRLNPPETECHACGRVTLIEQGVPIADGEYVDNDYPGDDWAGVHVCRRCFVVHRDHGAAALTALAERADRRRASSGRAG